MRDASPAESGFGDSKSISHQFIGLKLAKLLCLHVITEQRVLIPNIEPPVRNHWMRPGRFVRAFGLIEPPALHIFLAAGFNENNRTLLCAVVNAAIGKRD